MNTRLIFIFIIALIFAAIAAMIANNWIKNRTKPKEVVTSKVILAAQDIPFGIKLENFHIDTIDWPGSKVPTDSFSKNDDVLGSITKNSFYKGEVITAKRITSHLGGSTLSSLIARDSRAISIRVDDVVGVSGFVLPGNRVDILATRMSRVKGNTKAKSRTILQNIKVLAVDQEASPDKEKPAIVKSVTLELKPKQAETMSEAMQEGKIQLTLRNPLDSNRFAKTEEPKPLVKKRAAPAIVVRPW